MEQKSHDDSNVAVTTPMDGQSANTPIFNSIDAHHQRVREQYHRSEMIRRLLQAQRIK